MNKRLFLYVFLLFASQMSLGIGETSLRIGERKSNGELLQSYYHQLQEFQQQERIYDVPSLQAKLAAAQEHVVPKTKAAGKEEKEEGWQEYVETLQNQLYTYNQIESDIQNKKKQIEDLKTRMRNAGERIPPEEPRQPFIPSLSSSTFFQQATPSQPSIPLSTEWTTDEKIGVGFGMVGIGFIGMLGAAKLHHKATVWRKKRVRVMLHKYSKTFVHTPQAERDLLMAASYGWLNPIRYSGSLKAYYFKQAVAALPLDQEFSHDLWPVLCRLYFDKERIARKDRRKLRKLYNEARLQAKLVVAQKAAARERRRRRKKQKRT